MVELRTDSRSCVKSSAHENGGESGKGIRLKAANKVLNRAPLAN